MAAVFAFKCGCCGEIHEGSPSFGFDEPDHYACLTDEQKAGLATLTPDFCTITRDGHTDYFIRAVLEVPIHGVEEPFLWGVWVSLSERSYARYRETYDEPVAGEGFFGWVCNRIGVYPYEGDRGANVIVQGGGQRPTVTLHRGHEQDDPLVADQVSGISIVRAQELAQRALHGDRGD